MDKLKLKKGVAFEGEECLYCAYPFDGGDYCYIDEKEYWKKEVENVY